MVKPGARGVAAAAAVAWALAVGACASPSAVGAGQGPAAHPGATEFRYDGPADAVALRGTMTGWQPLPLDRRGAAFRLALRLPPGRYEYRLEVRREAQVVVWFPQEAERVEDGFGGENAVLRVR